MNTTAIQLGLLESAGLIQLAALEPELEYFFRHGLMREAAYSTLLKPQRRAWHLAAGEALEGLLAAGAVVASESMAPMLAQHFSIAGDEVRALRYFTQAAEAAFERYALAEAGDYYAQALATALAIPELYVPEQVRRLAGRYGLTLELRSRYEDALHHYAAMEELGRQRSDPTLELDGLLEQAKIYGTANLSYDPERSRALLERAVPLVERGGGHATQARLLWTLMLQNVMRGGGPEERLAFGEQALAVAQSLDLREQLAFIHQDLWYAYAGLLQWDRAQATLAEARRFWADLEHPVGQCETTGRLALTAMYLGDYHRALTLFNEAYQLATQIGSADMQALMHAFVGLIHADRGDYAQAIELSAAAIATAAVPGNVTALVGTQSDLACAYGELGAVEHGLRLAQTAQQIAETRFPLLTGWAGAARARLCLLKGEVAEAAALLGQLQPYASYQRQIGFMAPLWTQVALAEAELALAQGQAGRAAALLAEVTAKMTATGMRFRLPDMLYLRGCALLAQGRLALARSELQAARLEAIALDCRRIHWRILAALADIEDRSGQPEQAAQWRHQARPLVAYIADHTSADLQADFLAQASVQAVRA